MMRYVAFAAAVATAITGTLERTNATDTSSASGSVGGGASVFIDFEDASLGTITNFYDTSPQDYGVVFSGPAEVISAPGIGSSFGDNMLWQPSSGTITMTVAGGFVSPLEFGFAASQSWSVTIWNGATQIGGGSQFGSGGDWVENLQITFSGTATSVKFTGVFTSYVIDGLTFTLV